MNLNGRLIKQVGDFTVNHIVPNVNLNFLKILFIQILLIFIVKKNILEVEICELMSLIVLLKKFKILLIRNTKDKKMSNHSVDRTLRAVKFLMLSNIIASLTLAR